MLNRSLSRSALLRTAIGRLGACRAAAVIAGAAPRGVSATGHRPVGGVDLTTGPQKGCIVGVDAGDTGGVNVGAGRRADGRPRNRARPHCPAARATRPRRARSGRRRRAPANAIPDGPGSRPPTTPAGATQLRAAPGPAGRPDRVPAAASGDGGAGRRRAAAAAAGRTADPLDGLRTGARPPTGTAGRRRARARPDREDSGRRVGGDSSHSALIALALWLMWVRGRRRLERNAWVDADTGEMNVVAFETLLAQEWARSDALPAPARTAAARAGESGVGGRSAGRADRRIARCPGRHQRAGPRTPTRWRSCRRPASP